MEGELVRDDMDIRIHPLRYSLIRPIGPYPPLQSGGKYILTSCLPWCALTDLLHNRSMFVLQSQYPILTAYIPQLQSYLVCDLCPSSDSISVLRV